MTLGNRLKLERQSSGLTQRQLAAVAGIQANAQGNYESGSRFPRADYFTCLFELGIDVHYIVLGVRKAMNAGLGVEESQFIEALRLLRDEDREAIMQILATMAQPL